MYAVSQKGRHQTHNGKFANSQPIFRTFFTVKFSSKLAKYFLKIPLQRLKRFGYIITCYTVSELIVNCDHDLFTKATRYGHCLHHLLPATRPADHLRPRGHPFQLYPAVTDLHKKVLYCPLFVKFHVINVYCAFYLQFFSYVLSCICCVRLSYYR